MGGFRRFAIFVFHVGLPFLVVSAILFKSAITDFIANIGIIALIMIPAFASFLYALQGSKVRRLVLSEGVPETATITSIQTDDHGLRTTVYYTYQGVKRGSTEFETFMLILDPRALVGDARELLRVGDTAHVLVHPTAPNLSKLMLVIPPKFDSKLLDEDRKVPLLEGSG